VHEILTGSDSLEDAVDQLVEEANRMGGRDNITVILFRVADEEGAGASADGADTSETAERTATDLEAAAVQAAARVPETRKEKKGKKRPGRRRVKLGLVTVVVLVVLAGLAAAAVAGARSVYFVGQDERGLVTLYRGLPYDLPFGIDLYDPQYVSSVQVQSLRPFERRRLLDHELRSRKDAANLIRDLERGR
jgi:hypothetical protein